MSPCTLYTPDGLSIRDKEGLVEAFPWWRNLTSVENKIHLAFCRISPYNSKFNDWSINEQWVKMKNTWYQVTFNSWFDVFQYPEVNLFPTDSITATENGIACKFWNDKNKLLSNKKKFICWRNKTCMKTQQQYTNLYICQFPDKIYIGKVV